MLLDLSAVDVDAKLFASPIVVAVAVDHCVVVAAGQAIDFQVIGQKKRHFGSPVGVFESWRSYYLDVSLLVVESVLDMLECIESAELYLFPLGFL